MANSLPEFHQFDINTDPEVLGLIGKNGFRDLIIF